MSIKLPGGILRLIVNAAPAASEAPRFLETPALVGTGTIGTELSLNGTLATGEPTPELRYEWRRDGTSIPGATGPDYTIRPEDDLATLSCRLTARNSEGEVSAGTEGIVARYPAPTAAKALPDEILDHGEGIRTVEVAVDFTGGNLRFTVTGPEGVTIDATTGRVSIDTDRGWTSGTITVTAQNSGGSAASSFQVTLEREDTGTEPDYTPAATELRTSVEKDGVTFFFNEPAQVGQYCTGDWFVVMQPGLKLTATDPACRRVESTEDTHAFTYAGRNLIGRYVHGLQIDPSDADKQGFDSYAAQASTNRIHRGVRAPISIPSGPSVFQADWSPVLNMDPAFVMDENAVSDQAQAVNTPRGPLPLDRPMSLVKAVSRAVAHEHGRGGQEMLVVLTVVAEVPAEGAFRPPMGGPAVDLPVTWTEAGVQPFLENLPRLSFTHKTLRTPTTHPEYWQKMSRDARRCWQAWSARSTQIRNITPLWQADGKPMPYRREIADYMGAMLEALIADCPWQQKRDIFIGLVQLGIDQAAVPQFLNKGTAPTTSGQTSWDAGRSAPTVLAMAALPDNDWLQEAWSLPRAVSDLYLRMPGSSWEDMRSFNTITENQRFDPPLILPRGAAETVGVWDWIDPEPDSSPVGPVPGMLGHGTYNGRGTRPEGFSALPGSQGLSYLGINTTAMRDTLLPLWLIPGCFKAYGDTGALRWLDRLYTTDPTPLPQLPATTRWFREIRDNPLLEPFAVKTPNRLFTSPSVEGFGTALLVTIPPHEGDNGSPVTSLDLRYRPLSLTFDAEGNVSAETTLGPWVEVEDIHPNPEGRYVVSPEPTGGLLENTFYCVQVRYNNAVGRGPWSRTHRSSYTNDSWGSRGLMFSGQAFGQTGTQMAVTPPRFVNTPELQSYFTAGAPARILLTAPPLDGAEFTGFPFPDVAYQWKLNGTDLLGATTREITLPLEAVGKTVSCLISLNNGEGRDSITVTGSVVGNAVADTGYAPGLMQTKGNVQFEGRPSGGNLFEYSTTKRGTVAFIFGGRSGASCRVIDSNRFEVVVRTNGVVSVSISNGLTGTRGYMEFSAPRPEAPHWYLISVDTTQAAAEDRIRLWVRPAGSLYPPQRILPSAIRDWSGGTGSFPFDSLFRFAATSSHRLFPADPEEQSFIIGDLFMQREKAFQPEDFIAANGQYRDPATVGAPFLLMGSAMNADDWNEGRNLGSNVNPLPSAGGGGEFSALD